MEERRRRVRVDVGYGVRLMKITKKQLKEEP